jgi:hypothetical protein
MPDINKIYRLFRIPGLTKPYFSYPKERNSCLRPKSPLEFFDFVSFIHGPH